MTKKKSKLALYTKKGHHYKRKSAERPERFDREQKQSSKSPSFLTKRKGLTVISPYKSPISKRFKPATSSCKSSFFKNECSPTKSPSNKLCTSTPKKSFGTLTYTKSLWTTSLFHESPLSKRARLNSIDSPLINKKKTEQRESQDQETDFLSSNQLYQNDDTLTGSQNKSLDHFF